MEWCGTGSFQGRQPPCVGVVFNGPQPGDTGYEGRFTTCWRSASTGSGWQAALVPRRAVPKHDAEGEEEEDGKRRALMAAVVKGIQRRQIAAVLQAAQNARHTPRL